MEQVGNNPVLLTWKITPKEKRGELSFLYGMFFALGAGFILFMFWGAIGFLAALVLVAIVFISRLMHTLSTYMYELDTEGITITKDSREGRYLWNDFECFYVSLNSLMRSDSKAYYLKPRQSGIFKRFVIVHATVEVHHNAEILFKQKMPRKLLTRRAVLPLASYRFK